MGAHWGRRGGLNRFIRSVEKYVGPAMFKAGDLVADHAKGSIMDGAVSGKFHVRSRPGEPPKNDTRHLHDSIEVVQENPLRVLVSANAKYAVPLEYGTSRMEARPFFVPAVAATETKVVETIKLGVDRAVKEAGKGS